MKAEKVLVLSGYYAWISELVTSGRFSGQQVEPVRRIVRARTLAILKLLDNHEKSMLVQFLYDADLIVSQGERGMSALIALNGADLRGIDCSQVQMDDLCIVSAFLNNANFSGSFLYRANFSACDLIQADFSNAILDEVNFLMADLTGANLRGASLRGATISDEQLAQAACIEGIQR